MKDAQQQPADPTGNWLRQQLRGYSPEAPANAWERLVPHLPQPKRRRPLVFWVVGTIVGFLFLTGPKHTRAPLPHPAAPLKEASPKPVQHLLADATGKKLSSTKNLRKSAEASAQSAGKIKNTVPQIDIPNLSATNDPTSKHPHLPNPSIEALGHPTDGLAVLNQANPQPHKSPLERLPIKGSPLLFVLKESQPQPIAALILARKTKFPRVWFGIEAAPMLSMWQHTDQIPYGTAYHEHHLRLGLGWQAGLSLAVEPLKNWRVFTGLQHYMQVQEAAHSVTLRLMDGICLNPNDPGLKEYQFSYAVVSGGVQSDLTLRLQQQDIGTTMPDDEPFTLDLKTVHRSAGWRLPVSVERQFGGGSWRGFVRGGTALDFSRKNAVEVSHFSEACQDLCFQNGHHPAIEVGTTKRVALGWLAGAGIERRFASRAALRLEPFVFGQKGSIQYGLNIGLLFIVD